MGIQKHRITSGWMDTVSDSVQLCSSTSISIRAKLLSVLSNPMVMGTVGTAYRFVQSGRGPRRVEFVFLPDFSIFIFWYCIDASVFTSAYLRCGFSLRTLRRKVCHLLLETGFFLHTEAGVVRRFLHGLREGVRFLAGGMFFDVATTFFFLETGLGVTATGGSGKDRVEAFSQHLV